MDDSALQKPGLSAPLDARLREILGSVEGAVREPVGRSFHVHQLDGARLEAMVYLDPAGVRIDWVHGKGDCAITGSGEAIIAALTGHSDVTSYEQAGALTLYGDRALVSVAPSVFRAE